MSYKSFCSDKENSPSPKTKKGYNEENFNPP